MAMRIFPAHVRNGVIVPDDSVRLPDGTGVTVVADGDGAAFEVTAEEESELLEAIAEVEGGETVRAEELLARLRR